ncbi:MAG: filamentous hemagglutinin family protein [Sphingomonas sp.]|uniref:filamentous haemagglutinin family protein n=1 Tax=Sphingomonas sp. TaxID=28214 RepID=UPI003562ED72
MTHPRLTRPTDRQRSPSGAKLLNSASLAALAVAASFAGAGRAGAQDFNSMVAMQAGRVVLPDGTVSQWSGANTPSTGIGADGRPTMTIQQTKAKALLDWQQFQLKTNEVLEFQQQSADWIAVNRVHGTAAARIDGEIRAPGRVFIFNDNGVLIGDGAKINVRQLVTGAGVSDVNVDGKVTTIVQSRDKAILNWSDMSSQAGDVLRFQQEKKNWIALNRSLAQGTTVLRGDIKADGEIYLVAPQGLSIDGKVQAQQVIASALDIRDAQFNAGLTTFLGDANNRWDPTFSNSWNFKGIFGGSPYTDILTPPPPVDDPNDPLRYKLTIGRNGSIETGSFGKVMLFGPAVTNRGLISVRDEGQVILAAGDNIYLTGDGKNVNAVVGAFNPISFMRVNIPYMGLGSINSQQQVDFWKRVANLGLHIGDYLPDAGQRYLAYLNQIQYDREAAVGFHARNEGIIRATGGGRVDFRGLQLEQMGAIEMTSTALFRASVSFLTTAYDYQEYVNNGENGPIAPGNGDVIFGKGSLTQITPDLDAIDTIPLSSGAQSVGTIRINAARVHMQEDSILYMPSGTLNVLLDDAGFVFGGNRGAGANQNNESGTRFLMDRGATIDLSGWQETILPMGFHQVTGKLFAAQLADSPLQRDGPFYRKEITVDRRYGTNLANWESFDNLNQGTLAQFLINGGTFTMDVDDDFIMKAGSVIDVSGGKVTYQAGYINTTLIRTLDNRVIDIREADPDQLYMGFADQFVVYDTKWRTQKNYYIPFMSSTIGRYEDGYVEGGNAGSITIIAPDTLLQGTLLGGVTVGKYQRNNLPTAGAFSLNDVGESEGEYSSNNVIVAAMEAALPDNFGLDTKLSDSFGDTFGVEFDPETQKRGTSGRTSDNTTLTSANMFNRSTMGSYYFRQQNRVAENLPNFPPADGTAVTVEAGANLNLANGGSLTIAAGERVEFLGSFRSEGGAFSLRGISVKFGADTRIDTRGSWYNDTNADAAGLLLAPRVNGGSISITGSNAGEHPVGDASFILPDTMVLDSSGGGWVDGDGKLKLGRGGDIAIGMAYQADDAVDLSALSHARAYGLGGNGAYSLSINRAVYIGDALPDEAQGGLAPLLLTPDFFANSGFSKISLSAPTVTIGDGVKVEARSATLQLGYPSLDGSGTSYLDFRSGTDIYDVATIGTLPVEQRSAALRRGMDLNFGGFTTLGEGAYLGVEAGGSIVLRSSDIAGTLSAPGGKIDIQASNGSINIHSSAQLLAPGVALITDRSLSAEGRELLSGIVMPGGTISLGAKSLMIGDGAILDVSGAHALFDLPGAGGARQPTLVGSNGGSILVAGAVLSVDGADYRAAAGAPGARGGAFSINWGVPYGAPSNNGPGANQIYDYFSYLFDYGYVVDKDGNTLTSFFGTDLSNIDWDSQFGIHLDFAPGFKVESRAAFEELLNRFNGAAAGAPPLFLIGDNLTPPVPQIGPPVLVDTGLRQFLEVFGYIFPETSTTAPSVTVLSTDRIARGGFSTLSISSSPAVIFAGDTTLGGRRADGSFVFDRINLSAPVLTATQGSDVRIEAGIVSLNQSGGSVDGAVDMATYINALTANGVSASGADTRLTITAGPLLEVRGAEFYGIGDTLLASAGDIRLIAVPGPTTQGMGQIHSTGTLSFKADQIYANTAAIFTIASDRAINILPQDAGTSINGTPYEAAAQLTLHAPRITQGGTLRSPLGTITFDAYVDGTAGSGTLTLLSGSMTSVNADGHVIPYGVLQNGDTWIDPITGKELRSLPAKAINLKGDMVDLQSGAILDVAGSGDFYAREFIPGIGGGYDWLTGYRDQDYNWVADGSQVFAVLPDYEGDIAPFGLGGNSLGIGDKIYLSGGSGLKAGYYTLLPAAYAMLPGAYRVSANQHYAGDYTDMALGEVKQNLDGSTIQAGYRFTAGSSVRDPYNTGYLVMNGATLRTRSGYQEANASTFFISPAFLKKALRTNSPLGEIPRIPIDGGSVVIEAGKQLVLDATLKSKAGKGGRGGFADIKAGKIAVIGADTDVSKYDGYLLLDSDRLNGFGAESLLLGGVRHQGAVNLELTIGATDVVVDNKGSVLSGPEILLAASNGIRVEQGAAIKTEGQISGSSGDLRILPAIAAFKDDMGTPWDYDDVPIHGVLDQGAVLRLSSSEQVDILRNIAAVDDLNALFADPARLATVNAVRVSKGLAPLVQGGNLAISDGASLSSSRSLAMDATHNTSLASGASLSARQISAASSRVSVGDVPAGTEGLVFAGGSLGALRAAEDIALKSYSTIDFFGGATLRADGSLTLDTREVRVLAADGKTVTIAGKTLTLANSNGGGATAAIGNADLLLQGDNVYFSGGDKRISGARSVSIEATQRVIGQDDGTLFVPGTLSVKAGAITAESGSRLFFDAGGDVDLATLGGAKLADFETFGATLGITGAAIRSQGNIALTGGTVNLRARSGNVILADGSTIDVTSNISQIFDVKVGVGAGTVSLVSDRGDVTLLGNAGINVSGTSAGGDAGLLSISAGLGAVTLGGGVKGTANDGYRSGSFQLVSKSLGDFTGLNAALDVGGFRQARHFEFNTGDAVIDGVIKVRDFAMVANDGSISLAGTIETLGDNGGRVQLSAAKSVNLLAGSHIVARANSATGSGGNVFLETVGRDGGKIDLATGSTIDVSGTGEGGRLVRLRAPQIGNDMAIGGIGSTITGARSVVAEAFRTYDGITKIDRPLIDQVSADATAFMANAGAIRARLGSGVTVAPGIELRSDGDMELATDWDLHNLRFDGAAGVLTLRARGDLLINANLSDGFDGSLPTATLLDGQSWAFNLTAGANIISPNSLAVLPLGQLASGKGSLIVGGTADTIEYYYDPAHGNEHRLYLMDGEGRFVQSGGESYHLGWIELERDADGDYLDPLTGAKIAKDPVTGDYADTTTYARRPLPWIYFDQGGAYDRMRDDGAIPGFYNDNYGQPYQTARRYIQYDNSTGYMVRTGTAGINIAAGRDLELKYRPSVIYTAGRQAPDLPGFYAPAGSSYAVNGGDIDISVAGDIIGSTSPQLPGNWLMRRISMLPNGLFAPVADRAFDQSTWYISFANYQSGIGALGGGNVDITAGGDILNLSVNLPTTGRVTGNTQPNEAMALTTYGGGDLNIRAGGDIGSGKFFVADGLGAITAGGAFTTSTSVATNDIRGQGYNDLYYYDYGPQSFVQHAVYTTLFTTNGEFRLQSGGDLDIDAVLDPLLPVPYASAGFLGYTPNAKVNLFSAGGDVTLWNNSTNIDMQYRFGIYANPTYVAGTAEYPYSGAANANWELWPSEVSAVAASGDINILGGLLLAPAQDGSLDLLARGSVFVGYNTHAQDDFQVDPRLGDRSNYRSGFEGIFLSQAKPELLRTALNPFFNDDYGGNLSRDQFLQAGQTSLGTVGFSRLVPPDLHVGDTKPVRIYAGDGDIVTSAGLTIPKSLWLQAGGNIYFPNYSIQHNNMNDLSLIRAGKGLYLGDASFISIVGPGRLEIETGTDLWIPSNARGITSGQVMLPDANPYDTVPAEILNPGQKGADIGISVGYNQRPDYEAFDSAYLSGEGMADYLVKDDGKGGTRSIYLFDRLYSRGDREPDVAFMSPELREGFVNWVRERQGLAPLETEGERNEYLPTAYQYWSGIPTSETTPYDMFFPKGAVALAGAKPEFYLPEERQGLVNYVRGLQGLAPLATQAEQVAYLDTALSYWDGLADAFKVPFYREVLTMELRTTGREVNATENPRSGTTFRGYEAIATLYPGAEKRAEEALATGESRWTGDFETYASRVLSTGGGSIAVMAPGGSLKLANIAALPEQVGQPPANNGRGDATRSGLLSVNGGEINVFTHDSAIVNQSRILTAKGGNIFIWSSYGDIAAGKGAKTSITPTFFDYTLDGYFLMNRTPVGLPSGAGIGTVASVPGAPVADVDLIAPNGIVDAGDAGIRVSGNFNVFAVQILGTDNIDVAGIATGLPLPPAVPPIQLDDLSAKSNDVRKTIESAIEGARRNATVKSPSLIEVHVTGYGKGDCPDESVRCDIEPAPSASASEPASVASAAPAGTMRQSVSYAMNDVTFDLPSQRASEAVQAIGRRANVSVIYDSGTLADRKLPPLRGKMTPEQALTRLLQGTNVTVERVGPSTIVIRPRRVT